MHDRTADTSTAAMSGWMRSAALVAAGVVSLCLMLDPYALHGVPRARLHAGLPLLFLGVSGAYIYGFGFSPGNALARVFIHPLILLSFLVIGGVVLTTY